MITKESLKQQYPNHTDADIEELYYSGDIQDEIKEELTEEQYNRIFCTDIADLDVYPYKRPAVIPADELPF